MQANRAEGGSSVPSRKRPLPADSSEAGLKKKVDRRSEHEKRLMGDYSTPRTAQLIGRPRGFDSDEAEESVKARTMARKPGAGGHRPMDTLRRSAYAPNGPKPLPQDFSQTMPIRMGSSDRTQKERPSSLERTERSLHRLCLRPAMDSK